MSAGSGIKGIKEKITSIKSTQKFTKALQMVATSKMKKAQDRLKTSEPYAERIKVVVSHLAQDKLDDKHPFLIERPAKNVGFIVVGTDKGLCGGLNIHVCKLVVAKMAEYQHKGANIKICCVGKKSEFFFRRYGANILACVNNLGNQPESKDLIGIVKVMLDEYAIGKLDRIYLVYNHFVNAMVQTASIEQILPIVDINYIKTGKYWDYIYEPSAEQLINKLLLRYVESLVYQGVAENTTSEQAARVLAMKHATDNAGDLADDFQVIYNKMRQLMITRELSEITTLVTLGEGSHIELEPEITTMFKDLQQAKEHKSSVTVNAANKLLDVSEKQLLSALKKKFNKNIGLHFVENKKLLAGVKIQEKDDVIDFSVQGQLDKLLKILKG